MKDFWNFYSSKARIFRIRNLERVHDKRASPLWFIVSRVKMDQWYSTVSQSRSSSSRIDTAARLESRTAECILFYFRRANVYSRVFWVTFLSRIAFAIVGKVFMLFKRKEVTRSCVAQLLTICDMCLSFHRHFRYQLIFVLETRTIYI